MGLGGRRLVGDAAEFVLPCARAVRDLALGDSKRWGDSVQVSDVEQHPLRGVAEHAARREVENEEGLTTLDLTRVRSLLLHSNQNRALVVSEIDSQSNELLRLCYVLNLADGTDAYVELLEVLHQYGRLDGSGLDRGQGYFSFSN